jgi:hypothetical protein
MPPFLYYQAKRFHVAYKMTVKMSLKQRFSRISYKKDLSIDVVACVSG